MVSRVSHTTFDCRDAFEISTFWKQVKDRVHLDLEPTDRGRDDEIQRVLALGATALHDLRKETAAAGRSSPTQRATNSASSAATTSAIDPDDVVGRTVPVERESVPNLFVLTGAPGSGKTAILRQLVDGFRCVDEPAREVLAEQRATGGRGTWDQDPALFVRLLLERSIERHETARGSGQTTVFDRGIPDCVVYAVRSGTDPTSSLTATDAYRYHPHVFFLEPWSDIYEMDDERVMSFDDTVSFGEALRDVYERAGYTLVEVPRGSVDDRATFVRGTIAGFGATG